jgi:hypothetical protein
MNVFFHDGINPGFEIGVLSELVAIRLSFQKGFLQPGRLPFPNRKLKLMHSNAICFLIQERVIKLYLMSWRNILICLNKYNFTIQYYKVSFLLLVDFFYLNKEC